MHPLAVNSPVPSSSHVPEKSAPPRLVRSAHEFEAQMMKELMKPMTASDPLTGDGESSASGGALGEFATEALGRALSERGGFGIADKIVQDLSRSGPVRAPSQVTTKPHGDTVMKTR